MPVRLYALLTWTTLRRLPLIHSGAAAFLRRMLPEIARRHGTRVIELGIVRNHLHLVLELPPRVDVPRLVQGLKGASARIANRDGVMPRARLRWADGYDLRSLSVRDLARGYDTYGHRRRDIRNSQWMSPRARARAGRNVRPLKRAHPPAERALLGRERHEERVSWWPYRAHSGAEPRLSAPR